MSELDGEKGHEVDLPEPADQSPMDSAGESRESDIFVVGLGGSAGSLGALQSFLRDTPSDSGMAYVVVVHLSPEHESSLDSILQSSTQMPVHRVDEPMKIRENEVYVVPPGKYLSMTDGILQPSDIVRIKGRHVTVDVLFRTLADAHGPMSAAIVLSGGDGDGALGLKRVKERGGLTIAQDPAEAEFDGMPRAAIATAMVDWVLPVGDIPRRLLEYRENGRRLALPAKLLSDPVADPKTADESGEAALRDILAFLKARTGHDFMAYKRATILRRIARRMQVNGTATLEDYLAYIRTHPGETGALLQDLLISVTNFFRDHEAFRSLEAIIPELFHGRGPADQIRVWVPACATGEEAYSVAILLCEQAAKMESPPQIQIFATDIDQTAIDTAREGKYPEAIAADVSDERLRQFFSRDAGSYRVRKSVREVVLFALHDLLADSPFSRLDLICCRNLLIYLNRSAQAKVFDTFHFALKPGAKLFLGSSESAEEASNLFAPSEKKKDKIYTRRTLHRVGLSVPAGAPTLSFAFQPQMRQRFGGVEAEESGDSGAPRPEESNRHGWSDLHLNLLERIAPASVIVSKSYDIMHLSKTAGRFLKFAGGEPTMNLLKTVHPDLRTQLRTALFRATKEDSVTEIKGIRLELEGEVRLVDVSVVSAKELSAEFMLVTFCERSGDGGLVEGSKNEIIQHPPTAAVVQHLEEELDQVRLSWRDWVEQYEASTEELKASNEELQAMNEELRSATEELETGREELQSINEEIITINQELKSKVEELSRANSDLQNLMGSTNIATIFLNRQLEIKRFTPSTTGLFNFIPTDIGRPLSDLTHRLEYPEITRDAENVLEKLTPVEREVRDLDGRWFLVRMFPYRTTEDVIAGVVITCVDITARKDAEEARRWLSAIVESSNDGIISFTLDGDIVSWNGGAERIFGYTANEVKGRSSAMLTPPSLQAEKGEMVEKLRAGQAIDQLETVRLRKDGKLIDVSLSASVMRNEAGEIVGATAIIQDITTRKQAVADLKRARIELEERVETRTSELNQRVKQLSRLSSELTFTEQRERKRLAHVLHDDLQQRLVAVRMKVDGLQSGGKDSAEIERIIALIDELLTHSRSLATELSPPMLAEGLGRSLDWLCGVWMNEKYGLEVQREIDLDLDTPKDDLRLLLFLAVRELLFNVVKHSKVKKATVELTTIDDDHLRLVVRDRGIGFPLDQLGHAGCSGSGLGLLGLSERLELLGASLEMKSTDGLGVEAVIIAPRAIAKE